MGMTNKAMSFEDLGSEAAMETVVNTEVTTNTATTEVPETVESEVTTDDKTTVE